MGLFPSARATVVNVRDFGARGDDSTDDHAAITAAIAATPEGGITYLPAGIYRVSQSVVLRRNRTFRGSHAPKWFYRGGPQCAIKPHSSFASSQIIHIPDKGITGEELDNDGGRLENFCVDGNSKNTDVVGVLFEGLVKDWTLRHVDVSQTSGDAFKTTNTASGYPRGFYMYSLTTYSSGTLGSGSGHGYSLTSLTDSSINDCLAAASEGHGFLISNPGETKMVGCRAAFCKLDGLRIAGTPTNGGFQVVGFSTDRNENYGVRVSATGLHPVHIVGLLTRRDGANAKAGGGGYAGLAVLGNSGADAIPVTVRGLDQTVGVEDDGTGALSPQYGIKVQYARHVSIDGTAWGITGSVFDAGNVDSLDTAGLYRRSGSAGDPDTTAVATPTLAALANNGTGAPAPVLGSGSSDARGSLTFGSGTSPVVGSQVSVTFARPYLSAPVVTVASGNGGAASRAPFATSVTTTGFNVALNVVAAASQPSTTYAVTYQVAA